MRAKKIPLMPFILFLVISGTVISGIGTSFATPIFLEGVSGTASLVAIIDIDSLPPIKGIYNPAQTASVPTMQGHSLGPLTFRYREPGRVGPSAGDEIFGPSTATISSVSTSSIFTSTGFDGLVQFQSCACVPPDVEVAVGPNHVFEMVNLAGEIFTKNGTPVSNFTLSSFFNTGSDFISDPKLIFDSPSGRWFASILDADNIGNINRSGVKLAVSVSDDPTGVWMIYTVDVSGGRLPDQPIIGISGDKFLVSANIFTSVYLGAQWWVLNKNDLTSGLLTPRLVSFGPFNNLESVHPVQSLSSTQTQYMVSVGASDIGTGSSAVQLFSVNGVPGVSTVTTDTVSFPVQPISQPPQAEQPGETLVNTVDFRVMDAAWYQGLLWMGLNDKCRPSGDTLDRSCVRLIQIDTPVLTVTQDFDHGALGQYFFFPGLGIDSQGSLIVFYGFSSTGIYPSIAVTGQNVNDPFGSLTPPVTVKLGNAPGGAFGRYGDYFGAGVDPSDPTVVWGAGQYQTTSTQTCDLFGDPCWSTFISRASFFDFSISASPAGVSFNSGSTGQSTLTLTSLNGYAGTIVLAPAVSPATGLSASCSPTSVSVGGAFPTASSLCTFTSSTPGVYTVTVTATSGPRLHSTTVTVTVGGLSVSASPSALSIAAGSTGTSTVTLRSFGSFSGTVNLIVRITPVVAGGPSASISPTSVSLSPGQSATSALTVSTTTSTAKGVYTVNVTSVSGSQVRTVLIPLAVTPFSITISSTVTFTGVKVQTSGTLSVDSQPTTSLTLSGSPSVVASDAKTKKTLFSRTYAVQRLPLRQGSGDNYDALFLLPIYVSPYTLSSDIIVTMSGTTSGAPVQVTRDLDINNNGLVDQPDLDAVAVSFGCSQGQACYNARADVNADGVVNIIDLAHIGRYWMAKALVPDFTITANPTFLTVRYAGSGTSTITLTSINGFAGTVSLSVSVYRGGTLAPYSGLGTSLSPTSVTLKQGGTGSSTLTVSSNVAATYTVTIKASSGILVHFFSITVRILPCNPRIQPCPV